jgi:hypothetical protein
MSNVIYVLLTVILTLPITYVPAQGQPPQTTASFLTEHHVENNPVALRSALSSADREVRAVARLFSHKEKTSSPFQSSRLRFSGSQDQMSRWY